FWKLALKVGERTGEPAFECEVKTTRETRELTPADLALYQAVCLVNCTPDHDLWDKLDGYVKNGGGLARIPGGEDSAKTPDDEIARKLVPGKIGKLVRVPPEQAEGVHWDPGSYRDPVKNWFEDWKKQVNPPIDFIRLAPGVFRYWDVDPKGADIFILA